MLKIDKRTNKIYLTKGDTAQIVVGLFDKDGKERKLFEDDVITMTVKKRSEQNAVITKEAVDGAINFVPADTKLLATGQYYYDIQLTTFGGSVYTLIPATIFELGEEITV